MAHIANNAPGRDNLDPNTQVEVRTGFDQSWGSGFEVHCADDVGYRVRRRTDGHLLPSVFARDDVRPERRRSTWWW